VTDGPATMPAKGEGPMFTLVFAINGGNGKWNDE